MKNYLIALVIGLLSLGSVQAGEVLATVNSSASGTTSATVILDEGPGDIHITDLQYRLDTGVTTGTMNYQIGNSRYPVTSATSASGTVIWITNTGTLIAAGQYVIFQSNTASPAYVLRRVKAASTTSITVDSSLTPATTTSDNLFSCRSTVSRPVPSVVSQTVPTMPVDVWLPGNVPVAITLDGNTTSCAISVSGARKN